MYINYNTINDTVNELNYLKQSLQSLKSACSSAILQKDTDDWSKVKEIITELENKIDELNTTIKGYASDMSNIDAIF